MKSFKQYLSFSSVLAVLGLMCLLFGLAPCIRVYNASTTTGYITLFQATFGHLITAPNFGVVATPGLIVAFVLAIVGIILAILKNKFKLFGFLSSMCYIATGILVLLSIQMIIASSVNATGSIGLGTAGKVDKTGWIYAIGILDIIFGSFLLIDAVVGLSKPKTQEVY